VELVTRTKREEISCKDKRKKDTVSAVRRWRSAKMIKSSGDSRDQVPFSSWPGILVCPGLLAHLLDDLLESLNFSHFLKAETL
jgi:hypothetical protein